MKDDKLKLDKTTGLLLPKSLLIQKEQSEKRAEIFYAGVDKKLLASKISNELLRLEKKFEKIKNKLSTTSGYKIFALIDKLYMLSNEIDRIVIKDIKENSIEDSIMVKPVIEKLEVLRGEIKNQILSLQKNNSRNKISVPMIALKYHYERVTLNREQCEKVAKQYGHNSGNHLYNKYIYYSEKTNRIGKPYPFTKKKLENKIRRFESVLEIIEKKNSELLDELTILKSYRKSFD